MSALTPGPAAEIPRRAEFSVLAERERELLEIKGPCSSKECRLHLAHSGPCDTRPVVLKPLRWGDLTRVACTATGRYLGEYEGHELALYVSAMDNSLNIDDVDRRRTPDDGLPVPTLRELEAAVNGIRRGITLGLLRRGSN